MQSEEEHRIRGIYLLTYVRHWHGETRIAYVRSRGSRVESVYSPVALQAESRIRECIAPLQRSKSCDNLRSTQDFGKLSLH